jgi:hypothetical protein
MSRFDARAFDAERADDHDHVMVERVLRADPPTGDRRRAAILEDVPGQGTPTFERSPIAHYLRLDAGASRMAVDEPGAAGREA